MVPQRLITMHCVAKLGHMSLLKFNLSSQFFTDAISINLPGKKMVIKLNIILIHGLKYIV